MNGLFASAPARNVGSMRNQGIDLQIITRGNLSSELKYEITANGSLLQNEIQGLAPGIDFLTTVNPSFRGIQPIRNEIGQPLSAFFGYDVAGLYQVDDFDANGELVDGLPDQPGAGPGRFQYRDVNGRDADGNLTGQPDGQINSDDRTFLGSPIPDFTGGLAIRLEYKNFDLEMYGYASLGGEIFNQGKWHNHFYASWAGAGIHENVKESWTFENGGNDIPIFENVSNFSTNTQANSWYVEDGSFFRMQNITLGYNLPPNVLNRLKMDRLRVFASANNLFTITNYTGLDPMVGGAADTNFGIDQGNVPLTTGYTFGVNLGF